MVPDVRRQALTLICNVVIVINFIFTQQRSERAPDA